MKKCILMEKMGKCADCKAERDAEAELYRRGYYTA